MEQKKTVLIVEDEKNIVDIIRFNLQRTGYNTLEAYDGEAGLAMAREKKPDLILLDGGKGHVHAVQQVLDSMNVSIPLYGLVKDDKHRTRAIAAQGEEIQINANRKLFSLMTNIQDEVHRFSLSFQQQTHKKKTYELELTKIKGIGEAKALALIKHFKTKQALKDASPDEIASVAKVKEEKAKEIYDFIKENF